MYARALIVEDDADTREALALVLEVGGLTVTAAADGRQALDYLRSHQPPAFVLLDLMMPGMDGWEFLAQKRRDPVLAAVPVVIVTAAADLGPDAARALGAEAVVHKPADPKDLLAAVGHYC
jgi:CheY-like chemotaxis protein